MISKVIYYLPMVVNKCKLLSARYVNKYYGYIGLLIWIIKCKYILLLLVLVLT